MPKNRSRRVPMPAHASPRALPPQAPPTTPIPPASPTTTAPGARQAHLARTARFPTIFPPGEPLAPTPGIAGPDGAPRQWSYPVGYNIAQRPRATEQTSFQQLRSLAALYDGVQL